MKQILSALFLLTVLSLAVQNVGSAEKDEAKKNPYLWKPQTKSVAVFKNGLAFYIREGETNLRDGWCVAETIPPAAFGTLAIFANDKDKVVDIVGAGPGEIFEFDDKDLPKDVAVKRKRMELSLNLKAELQYSVKGNVRKAAGEIVSVGAEFVILDDGDNNFAVPLNEITRMQVLGLPLRLHLAENTQAEKTAEKPDEKKTDAAKPTSIGMAYLTKGGITWIPEYTLRITDEENAELTLRGTVINEGEDLIHTDIHLVVGVPNFVHANLMAPIAAGQAIRTIGTALSGTIPKESQFQSQITNSAAIFRNRGQVVSEEQSQPRDEISHQNLERVTGNLPKLDAIGGTDFTVYTKGDMTLRRGEKAILTLFTQKVKISNMYHWKLGGSVEHRLVLINQTGTPWTTGPCLVISPEKQPLSEDVLYYTAKNGRCELPLTAAINIATESSEKEVSRETKKYSPNNSSSYFDLVKLAGELKLQNYEKNPVEILITGTISGAPLELGEQGKATMKPDKLRLLEKEANVRWMFTMKPGENKSVTYQYERYVPSN
jgi:hypothetical protein